ncbi:hypothetical protein COCCU_00460 [Corynebacterium occultum]|uniref:Wadjet protein JetD C-terminal domain-containing protein n=1 Tax=Corynebacterium occultum TaxID=2675219 RepID=A0A6B8W7Y3_9CORY|nr:Wadjet anti-phage system protein JetD domain-containing protein [Corynebacterium occultum]QGU06060.1 hypothetical protein COCCU_00460 [Corynebacterium occultum]
MLSLIDARARARRFLDSHERELLAGEFAGFGFPLRPPTAAQAAGDTPATREFIRQWQGHPYVETALRNWSSVGFGRQEVPVRVQLDTISQLVDFTGYEAEWASLVERRELLVSVVGSLAPVIVALPLWRNESLADLRLAGEVVEWFENHPSSGVLPRAVAVEGVHGKWLENHRPLVESLLAGRHGWEGRADLGLAAPPRRVRLRFHDSDAPAGLGDMEIPLADLAHLSAPEAVIMVENLESFLALPTWPGVVLAWGAGYRAVDTVQAPFFRETPLFYWGDLDADGYAILDAVRALVPETLSVLMDEATVQRWKHLGVEDRSFQPRIYERLLDAENAGLDALIMGGHLRIEQERIRFDVVVEAFETALGRG